MESPLSSTIDTDVEEHLTQPDTSLLEEIEITEAPVTIQSSPEEFRQPKGKGEKTLQRRNVYAPQPQRQRGEDQRRGGAEEQESRSHHRVNPGGHAG